MTPSEGTLDLCQSSMHFCCPEESHTHLAHVQALLCLVVPCVDDSQVHVNDDDVYQLPGAAETPLPGFYHLGPCCSVSAEESTSRFLLAVSHLEERIAAGNTGADVGKGK